MRKFGLVLWMLALATLACSLGSGEDNAQPTSIPIISRTATLSLTPTFGLTPSPTSQLRPTPTTDQLGGNNTTTSNCVIRSDWPIYTVQAGDTLGIIAERISSTTGELTSGNCLANPDAIFVGQQLRVPRLPAAATTSASTGSGTGGTSSGSGSTTGSSTGSTTGGSGTTGSTAGGNTAGGSTTLAPTFQQALIALPTQPQNNALITFQPTIALNAGVVDNADTVRYYAGVSATDTSPVNIATDIDPFDGTQVEYTFNDFDPELYFWAVAENEFGTRTSNIIHVVYNPDAAATGGAGKVTITPNLGFDGTLYTVQYGTTVALNWAQAPTTASRVDFFLTPGGTAQTPVLIGSDSNPADGAILSWTVPQWVLAHLHAVAMQGSSTLATSDYVNVYSEGVTPSGN